MYKMVKQKSIKAGILQLNTKSQQSSSQLRTPLSFPHESQSEDSGYTTMHYMHTAVVAILHTKKRNSLPPLINGWWQLWEWE